MHLQQKNSNTTYSGGVRFFSYKQMLAREREQIKENILVTNEDERGNISLGKMNSQLLQKNEELTLYIIQQQKEIDALKAESKSLQKVIEK
jgi:hypothetical protein